MLFEHFCVKIRNISWKMYNSDAKGDLIVDGINTGRVAYCSNNCARLSLFTGRNVASN